MERWQSGQCGGLENHCTARYRGFESLSLPINPNLQSLGFLICVSNFAKYETSISYFIYFLIDLYFYFGVISFFEKQPVGQVIFKISYWILSLIVYVAIIYLILYSDKTTPSIKFNNNIIYSSLFFIFFSAKLVGCFPLITDDILRLFKQIFNLFSSNESKLDVSRLNFLRNTALVASGFIVSSMLLGIKFGRFNFKNTYVI